MPGPGGSHSLPMWTWTAISRYSGRLQRLDSTPGVAPLAIDIRGATSIPGIAVVFCVPKWWDRSAAYKDSSIAAAKSCSNGSVEAATLTELRLEDQSLFILSSAVFKMLGCSQPSARLCHRGLPRSGIWLLPWPCYLEFCASIFHEARMHVHALLLN